MLELLASDIVLLTVADDDDVIVFDELVGSLTRPSRRGERSKEHRRFERTKMFIRLIVDNTAFRYECLTVHLETESAS